ncbi:bacterial regulatory s, tetR family protein [Mycobacterium kansasii 662]|uniref:Bacterial regulatory proteins, tetR family n=4 Tax=Mycobacterium kansasii TaxID=1768 RepID=A0A653F3S0_MYCKA|nr:TetR family transcriptional regulator [Mycobacterium kansasii ATCC 12478]ARG58525.1 TetR family transcriptional regulator [Mycobacterium kansasii]EUA00479.1 bacterial regulatory s, tetR family protein [Mycobacterium kansasii 824]EUA18649.1 bacterial regulatory s, tetR family protein [Mycobacterium kansasii 662]ARG71690.1 TetR family transcriptional regulator [Mycobacterium kansasii]
MGWVGRPRRHDTEAMLDAARSIALESGARAVTVDAIAALSGASVGSLYNRFGSRDKILTAAWQRALERFQEPFLDQLRRDDLDDAALGAARWIMEFARTQPEDARLLAAFRPADVLTDPNAPAARRLAGGNAAIRDALRRLAERTGGGERARELLSLAVIDIAGGAIRRRLLNGAPISAAFEADVLAAVVAVLDRIALR